MTAPLFTPLEIGPVTVPNRIAVSPMCQYSADDGSMNDWHLQNLMNLAMSGAGLVMVEATAVERIGRITHGCTGLYSDNNEHAMGRVLAAARAVALPGTRFGIQLAHAGRKASAERPWEGGAPLKGGQDPWVTAGPSSVPFAEGWHTPEALDQAGIERILKAFADAARRAVRIGFEVLEAHLAHGYLGHAFHSPLANRREDAFGGDAERRMAFPLAAVRAIRGAVPDHVAVAARITGSDWVEGGLTIEDGVALARRLKAEGLAYACVTSGGGALARIPVGPGYQVPFAQRVKAETGITTRAVGMIVDPNQANDIVARGEADAVAIARGFIDNPRWGWHAAETLGVDLPRPRQYERAKAALWPGAKLVRGEAARALD